MRLDAYLVTLSAFQIWNAPFGQAFHIWYTEPESPIQALLHQ
jgi:hypothetical protein